MNEQQAKCESVASKKEEIGYAWNCVADLGNGRQFSVSGNFLKGTSANEMNVEADKVLSVIDRQQAKAASIGAEQEIEVLLLRRGSAAEDLARINAKYDEKGHMNKAEEQQKEAATVHLEKLDKDIEFKMGVLEKLKKEAK